MSYDWHHRYLDEAPHRDARPGFGPISEEEREIMQEILDAPDPRPIQHILGCALEAAFENWAGRPLTPHPPRPKHADYLLTPEWKARRGRALLRAGRRCQRCERWEGPLDVHHLTYDRLGCERESDLIVLCRSCHAAEHGKPADA